MQSAGLGLQVQSEYTDHKVSKESKKARFTPTREEM